MLITQGNFYYSYWLSIYELVQKEAARRRKTSCTLWIQWSKRHFLTHTIYIAWDIFALFILIRFLVLANLFKNKITKPIYNPRIIYNISSLILNNTIFPTTLLTNTKYMSLPPLSPLYWDTYQSIWIASSES
jgi:hypothetical protein